MSYVEEKLTEQFYRWELRGRGWQTSEHPVGIEPPFRPFTGHFVPPLPKRDDGRKHTMLSGFLERVGKSLSAEDQLDGIATGAEEEEPEPEFSERAEVVESQIVLPRERKYSREAFSSLLTSLSSCEEPLIFEVLGTPRETVIQFSSNPQDASLVRRQVQGRFAGATVNPSEAALLDAWSEAAPSYAVAEFGLEREFMLTLDTGGAWYAGLLSALSDLAEGELGLLQVIFEPVRHRWAESGLLAVSDGVGGPFFVNRPNLLKEALLKFRRPMYAVVLRIASCANDSDRAWQIIAEMASGLSSLSKPDSNSFVPLGNDDYDAADHEEDLLRRQSRRAGMLLNLDELVALVHFPDASVHAPKLRQETGRSRPAPQVAADSGSLVLGENVHAGTSQPVILSVEQRVRHVHVMGASGTGKSTLLLNLIRQDIENGEGIAVLDPHGDLIEQILGIIPENRIADVVLVDPADEEYSVGFNILSAHSDFEKTLLASDLVSIFQRLSTSWGDQMGSVLDNAILAFLESSKGGTLADLRRFLLDASWRKEFLRTVRDPDMVYYWEKGFPQLGGNKSIGPVLTRLETFLAPKPIRYMVSQRENRLDFADITDSGKIFLAKLSQGQMGRENAWLLGSLLVAKFQQTVMARQRVRVEERRPFWFYIDEFHHFITPSMAEILSGARKYRLGMTLAHQDLAQLKREQEVSSAVLANAATRIVFRVSEADARSLEDGFAHFGARELQNLDIGEAICRIGRSDADFNLRVPQPEALDDTALEARRDEVISTSRQRYARSREDITADLTKTAQEVPQTEPPKSTAKEKAAPATLAPSDVPAESPSVPQPPAPPVSTAVPPLEAPPPKPADPITPKAAPASAPALGRGGELHQAAQMEIKQIAESLGYRATIEKQLPGGKESADLYLERDGMSIACEISVTNTLDYEIRNAAKCLKSDVSRVAVIALEQDKLGKLEAAMRNSLPPEQLPRIGFFLKGDFVTHLQNLVIEQPAKPPAPSERMHKGWRVKASVSAIDPEEAKLREAEASRILAATFRRKKKP